LDTFEVDGRFERGMVKSVREIDLNREREFENSKVTGDVTRSKQSKYYWATRLETERHQNLIESMISGKDVLEIGCSTGGLAAQLSTHSKSYLGTDISDKAIGLASARGLPKASFVCCDGHSIELPAESFDCVIVDALLHHMDLSVVLVEVHRLLRPNGILFFNEPLGTNPLFSLYRALTPGARTPDEHPFRRADIKFMGSLFDIEEIRWFGFLSIGSAFVRSDSVRRLLSSIDRVLSRTPTRYLFWQFSGFAVKKAS
jgi:SAM-dependent methyltransferase